MFTEWKYFQKLQEACKSLRASKGDLVMTVECPRVFARFATVFAFTLVYFILTSGLANAQCGVIQISGSVTDQSGAAVPVYKLRQTPNWTPARSADRRH